MDHSLEDSLNLESAMGEMDFESAEDVASQAGISLDTSQEEDMAMEFEHIEEQPILMDSGSEEIIVTDFMGDQFNLQEYSIHDDQTTGMTTTEDSNQQDILASQSDNLDIQFEPQNIAPFKLGVGGKQKYISVKATPSSSSRPTFKKSESAVLTTLPRQIAIAPKPPKLVPAVASRLKPIAPRPVALVKNVPLGGVLQSDGKGNAVLAQIGKQLVVMPSGSSQKIKVVSSGTTGMSTVQYIKAGSDQALLIPSKNVSGLQTSKPIMAKVIVQGQSSAESSNQPAVITKLQPAAPPARYVMQQKTVPIIGNQVVMGSPTKHGVKFTKKHQIIAIKSPTSTSKLLPAPTAGGTTKKVVISANPTQNVILKTTAPPKTAQITKDGKVVLQGQRSQLHQINVPGKGIQYIRLITNQSPAVTKTVAKAQTSAGPPKSFVLTKGNLIQVSGGKPGAQPPPLLFTGNTEKRPQKLVRIAAAPMSVKSAPVSQAASVRSAQSLLAPLLPEPAPPPQEQDHGNDAEIAVDDEQEYSEPTSPRPGESDSKAALHALIADAVQCTPPEQPDSPGQPSQPEINIKKRQSSEESDDDSNGMEHLVPIGSTEEHPLIVISSNYMTQESKNKQYHDSSRSMQNVETDPLSAYQSPPQAMTDGDAISDELGLKPRRACNCTKSQCLKLYCDCFANGEFCNSCNCNNCHNNLDNEELRQKAIRACLERNPNAFRPKIGKTKAGGPEIIRRHNKGCNCKRSGCLKNYCECYEAKIACTAMCKCVGCRNVEDGLQRRRPPAAALYRPPPPSDLKQPCSFMTTEVIEAVCQCLIAASVDSGERPPDIEPDPVRDVIEEFSRCLQDVISASHQAPPQLLDEGQA